jgi:hypothetical protein
MQRVSQPNRHIHPVVFKRDDVLDKIISDPASEV